jgi:uncharacterized membrane protein
LTVYELVVLVHVLSAVTGLGASFAMPFVMKSPQTTAQLRYSLSLNQKIEKPVKIGSILLLITGIVLGIMNPALFSTGWYIASLVIYVLIQPIVAVIMPKRFKKMDTILLEHHDEKIPESIIKLNIELRPYNAIIHSAAVIIIVLMVLKPF